MTRQTSAQRDDRYDWDPLGQLTAVHHRDGATTRFGYDAFGRRVFKEHTPAPPKEPVRDPLAHSEWAHLPLPGEPVPELDTAPRHILSGRTHYFWAGDDLLAEARGDFLTEYAQWGLVTEALWEDGRIRHVVNSQQGVPQELVDDRGQLVWQGTFDDWGRLVSEKGSTTCRLRLPGQLADDETGLHYNRFRYYSPEAGQFVSADPIRYASSSNLYRFAPNVVRWVDPLGLTCGRTGLHVSPSRREHILEGDGPGTGTGHGPNRGNTTGAFPDTWTDDQTIGAIERVANSPTSTWRQTTGPGFATAPVTRGGPDQAAPTLNRQGRPVRFEVHGRDHGQNVVVIVEPAGEGIVTGYSRGR